LTITLITAVLNSVEIIEDCINSILHQTYSHIEHIIIDGGSTDGTLDIIKKYHDKIAKWISEPDNGIHNVLNKGLTLANGDVVRFLYADDVYAHNKLY
jgi:glycosyltransferase involved in cell wall biosynthesis